MKSLLSVLLAVSTALSMSVAAMSAGPMMKVRGGSVVALVTPMTKTTNEVDYQKLTDLLKWHLAQGTDGAVILGTTGESTTISMDERTQIIKVRISSPHSRKENPPP